MEYYPGTNDFGKTAWCIRDEVNAARYYTKLCLGAPVNERIDPQRYSDTTGMIKSRIWRPRQQIQHI